MYALLELASPNQVTDAAPGPGTGDHVADGAAGTLPMVRQMSWPDLPRPGCAVQAPGKAPHGQSSTHNQKGRRRRLDGQAVPRRRAR